jgi:hypothetical protein
MLTGVPRVAWATEPTAPQPPRSVLVLPRLDEIFARVVTPEALRARRIALLPMLHGTTTLGIVVRGEL